MATCKLVLPRKVVGRGRPHGKGRCILDRRPLPEVVELDRAVLSHVDIRVQRTSAEIHDRLVNDWGSCGRRRLYRSLRRLIAAGAVIRIRHAERRTGQLWAWMA